MVLRPALALLVLTSVPAFAVEADAGPPFGNLTLVDEVNAGDAADPHAVYEDPAGASHIETVLGVSARVMPMGDTGRVFAYKLGAGKGLVAGHAYLLSVEYPEDKGRQIVIINRGADETRTLATGQTIGDAREGYTYPAPESLQYPLSGKWEAHRTLFFLHDRFQGIKAARNDVDHVYPDAPADGFWVIIGQFRLKDSPLDAGAAVARIRLFDVPNPSAFDAAIHPLPPSLPSRHLFWREEMADAIISAADPSKRGVSNSIDWYEHKIRLARFLGINTFSKDLLEFGYTQFWDTTPGGGNNWFYSANQPQLWGQIIDLAKSYGLSVLPYYEYAGAMGAGENGTPSYGYQHHCRPLGDRTNNAYTDIWWSESACVDVSDPAALDDAKKLLSATIGLFKDKAEFVGAWFRTRPSNWPVSFADETLTRFGNELKGGTAPTRDQLKADPALLQEYYGWYFAKRKAFLVAIRDWLRQNVQGDAQVMLTSQLEESLHVPTYADWYTPTDDVTTWNTINTTSTWQWRFNPTDWAAYVAAGKFVEMTTRMSPPTADTLTNHWPEMDHSAPPPDPANYKDVDGVFMAMPFSRQFTVSSAAQFDVFREKSGLTIVRHFNLNEEDGDNPNSPEGCMSKTVGYFVSDVDRAGPYSMLAEARAVAYGDPRNIGYLSSSSFNRGFPEYARAFDSAFLSLPALPSAVVSGASSDADVVVREIDTPADGQYFALVNPALVAKTSVTVSLPEGDVVDLVRNQPLARGADGKVTLDFYPGQLYALHVGAPVTTLDAGTVDAQDAGTTSDAGVAEPEAAPSPAAGRCGCSAGPGGAFALLALALLFRRRAT